MAVVRLTPRAERDLKDIWITIASDNLAAADRLLARIADKLEHLARHPEIGVPRPDIDVRARMLVEGNYLVLYEVTPQAVEVVAIVHGARDLGKAL